MAKNKNKYSTVAVYNKKGFIIGYLSSKDEENGLDIKLDLLGYTLVVI